MPQELKMDCRGVGGPADRVKIRSCNDRRCLEDYCDPEQPEQHVRGHEDFYGLVCGSDEPLEIDEINTNGNLGWILGELLIVCARTES